jgi:hypothetical protein
MPKAYSLHIGVSYSDGHAGPLGTALGCDEAAKQLQRVAETLGYADTQLLRNSEAKHCKVTDALKQFAGKLDVQDFLLITLAGHGRELSGPGHGPEPHDQALVLFDDYLVDDEIYSILSEVVKKKANVVIIAEGCHTGSIETRLTLFGDPATRARREDDRKKRPLICPDVLVLAATSATSVASAAQNNGVPLFTRALLDNYEKSVTYDDLRTKINAALKEKAPECVLNPELLHKGAKLPGMKPFKP